MQIKKLFLTLSAFSFLFLINTIKVNANFSDYNENYIYSYQVERLNSAGIVNGYSDDSFRPGNTITRAEFTKTVVNAYYDATDINNCIILNGLQNSPTIFYPDVSKQNIFAKYICVAQTNNVIKGYSDGNFYPELPITMAEAIKIISNVDNGSDLSPGALNFDAYVYYAFNHNFIPIDVLNQQTKLTRGVMAYMIFKSKINVTEASTLHLVDDSNLYFQYSLFGNNTQTDFVYHPATWNLKTYTQGDRTTLEKNNYRIVLYPSGQEHIYCAFNENEFETLKSTMSTGSSIYKLSHFNNIINNYKVGYNTERVHEVGGRPLPIAENMGALQYYLCKPVRVNSEIEYRVVMSIEDNHPMDDWEEYIESSYYNDLNDNYDLFELMQIFRKYAESPNYEDGI